MQHFRSSRFLPLLRHFSTSSNPSPASLDHIFIPAKNPEREPLNLVVLHGLLGSASNFRTIISNPKITSLANSYLLDLRNHGNSEHRDTMTSKEMAQDVYNFVKEKNLTSNLVIMGHSMGARVAMTFCMLYPDILKGSVIVDLLPHDYYNDPKFKMMHETETMLKKLVQIDMDQEYKVIAEKIRGSAKEKAVADFVMTNIRKDEKTGKYRWKCNLPVILKNYGGLVNRPEGEEGFKGPVKIIFGGASDYYDEKLLGKFKEVFPRFDEKRDVKVIPEAGHWVHFVKPSEFIEEVSGFLRKL